VATSRRVDRKREFVEIEGEQRRYLRELLDSIEKRTGLSLGFTDLVRALVDQLMAEGIQNADMERAIVEARSLTMLRESRKDIEREIRQTESDLHQALVHSRGDGGLIEVFHRNLRYQKERLRSLDTQEADLRGCNGDSDGTSIRFLRSLFFAACSSDGGSTAE